MVTPVSTTTAIIKISIPTMMAGCALLEEYVNDEMNGAHRIMDKDGDITAAYMYVIADE